MTGLVLGVYSLNAPVPVAATRRQAELADALESFERIRDPLTLVIKRFGDRPPSALEALERTLAELLRDWGPIAARADTVGTFKDPASGPAPVVYLAVESPGLEALHADLVDRFGLADPAIEGDSYVPHITLARGGPMEVTDAMDGLTVPPVEWVIEEVILWTARHERPVSRLSLPQLP